MFRPAGIVLLLALGACLLAATPARAWTEFLGMDALPEHSGWTTIFDGQPGSTSGVSGGILTLTSQEYREYVAPADWINSVDAAAGYVIEFRMRILDSSGCYPRRQIGLWFHDNTYLTMIGIDPGRVYVSYPGPDFPFASLDATQWHTYTIMVQGARRLIHVDGVPRIDYPHPGIGAGSRVLMFGDLGECGPNQSEWDYVAYQLGTVVPAATVSWGRIKALYRGGH